MIVSHLHSPGLPDGLDVVSELPEEQVVSFLVRVELLDPCDSIDQGLVQSGCGLLQQDLETLDDVHQDLLPSYHCSDDFTHKSQSTITYI